MSYTKSATRKRTGEVSRRSFVGGAVSTAAALTIAPRHVLGGRGYIAPSDKITAACIGVGAQGTRVMMDLGLVTEAVLLGAVALRAGKKLSWDGPNMKALNAPEAQQYVRGEYGQGWTL